MHHMNISIMRRARAAVSLLAILALVFYPGSFSVTFSASENVGAAQVPSYAISGFAWDDIDGNGSPDICGISNGMGAETNAEIECETLLPDWTIELWSVCDAEALDYTDENGDGEPDGVLSPADSVVFTEHYLAEDLGADVNDDGVVDAADKACADDGYPDGVLDSLKSSLLATTLTDDGADYGWYEFPKLSARDYVVCQTPQPGWVQTFPTANGGCHFVSFLNDFTVPDTEKPDIMQTYNFGNQNQLNACDVPNPLDYVSEDGTPGADGILDLADAVAFTERYMADNPEADVNGTPGVDYGDYLCAQSYYSTGNYECPVACDAYTPVCGDTHLDVSLEEECDDGNTTDGDGCSAQCTIEQEVATLSGIKYEDVNGNGQHDEGEPLLNGWEICQTTQPLPLSDGTKATSGFAVAENGTPGADCVLTGSGDWPDGYYEFTYDSPTTATIAETPQPGWVQNEPANGDPYVVDITNPTTYSGYDFGNMLVPEETPVVLCDGTPNPLDYTDESGTGAPDFQLTISDATVFTDLYDALDPAADVTGNGTVDGNDLSCAQQYYGSGEYVCALNCTDPPPTTTPAPEPEPEQTTAPVLTIEKTADVSTVIAGGNVTYTLTIANTGDGNAENVSVSDPLPQGFFVTLNGDIHFNRSFGDMKPGEATTFSYTVTVDSSVAAGDYVNTATVQATNHDPVSDSATITVRAPVVLGVERSASDTAEEVKLLDTGVILNDTNPAPRTGQVLGAEDTLAETGAGTLEYLLFVLAALLIAGGAIGIRRANSDLENA